MRRYSISSLVLLAGLFVAAGPVSAGQEGRVAGTVVDQNGNPLENAKVTVFAVNYEYETERITNKKGRFNLLVMDATREYGIRIEKEGFATIEEPFDPPLGDTLRKTWTMTSGSGGPASSPGAAGVEGAPIGPAEVTAKGAAGRKYAEGLEAFQAEDLDTARASFEEVIETAPEIPEAHTALAMVLLRQEEFEQALAEANKVMEMKPDDVLAMKIQYEAYKGLGNEEMEEALLNQLIEKSPDQELARLVFNSAVGKVQAGDLAGGAARFEQVREMDPSLMPVYSALARVYFDLGRYDESIQMADEFLAQNPTDGQVLGVLYLAQEALGKDDEAQATFDRLKGTDSSQVGRVMQEMGVANFNSGNLEQARILLEKVLEIQPNDPRTHYHLGLCYVSMGETAKGKEMLTRFVELAPDDPDAAVAREMLATL